MQAHIIILGSNINTCFVFLAGVIILTAVANRFRLQQLNKVEKFVMSYGGLRGAVAFALVLLINKDHIKLQPMFVSTTITVVYFTVFFQVSYMVEGSAVHVENTRISYRNSFRNPRDKDTNQQAPWSFTTMQQIGGQHGDCDHWEWL